MENTSWTFCNVCPDASGQLYESTGLEKKIELKDLPPYCYLV